MQVKKSVGSGIRVKPLPIVAVLLSLAAGCVDFGGGGADTEGMIASENGDLLGRFVPDPDPPAFGDNALGIDLATADGAPVEGASLTLTPFMEAMGHGSPEVPVVEELGGGSYVATGIVYSMTGGWRLTIDVEAGAAADSFVLLYQVE